MLFVLNGRSQSATSVERKKNSYKSLAVREVHKTRGEDGKEKITVSMPTETEWSWLEMIKFLGKTEEELATLTGKK